MTKVNFTFDNNNFDFVKLNVYLNKRSVKNSNALYVNVVNSFFITTPDYSIDIIPSEGLVNLFNPSDTNIYYIFEINGVYHRKYVHNVEEVNFIDLETVKEINE